MAESDRRPPREMISMRISKTGLDAIDARAKAEDTTRAEMLRTMLGYAIQKMPQGWGRSGV